MSAQDMHTSIHSNRSPIETYMAPTKGSFDTSCPPQIKPLRIPLARLKLRAFNTPQPSQENKGKADRSMLSMQRLREAKNACTGLLTENVFARTWGISKWLQPRFRFQPDKSRDQRPNKEAEAAKILRPAPCQALSKSAAPFSLLYG